MINKDYKKQGSRNKINGANFERKVRKDLESKGFICSKWQNNVEFEKFPDDDEIPFTCGKCVPAKSNRFMKNNMGFPDFIAYKNLSFWEETREDFSYPDNSIKEGICAYEIIFIECKTNGYLSKEEKEKASWYLENNYCSKFLIASKKKVGRKIEVEYKEFGK